MTIRVLYTAFDVVPSPKGASRHITAFTRALVDAGYEVTLLTVGLPELPPAEPYAGAKMLRPPSPEDNFLRRALCFGDAVWEHLREHEGAYDIIHFRDIWSGQAALQARERFEYPYRTLFEANGLPSVELKYHYPALAGTDLPGKLQAQERAILGQVDAIVCVSGITAIYLHSLGAPRGAITVIPNGVDPALFRMQPWQPSKRPKLVYIGTLAMWQGLPTAIQAMPVILAAFPEAELHLIGPSKRRHQKRLVKQAAKLGLDDGTVCFPGPVSPEQMPVQLASASVCLAPLVYSDRNVAQGCCPIKVLEYAAAGRPIVASDLPVVRELFGEDEVLFFQPGDTAGLARQISYLLSHPQAAQVLAQRAAEKVRQAFTWQQSGERLLEVYAHLVETETPGRAPATTPALAPP